MKPRPYDNQLALSEFLWRAGSPEAFCDLNQESPCIVVVLNSTMLHTICHFFPRRQLLVRLSSDLEPWPVRRTGI